MRPPPPPSTSHPSPSCTVIINGVWLDGWTGHDRHSGGELCLKQILLIHVVCGGRDAEQASCWVGRDNYSIGICGGYKRNSSRHHRPARLSWWSLTRRQALGSWLGNGSKRDINIHIPPSSWPAACLDGGGCRMEIVLRLMMR